jgi:hypothetical protein
VGANAQENLNVTLLSCQISGNAAAVGTGYGLAVQYTHGLAAIGTYSEGNKQGWYADTTCKNIKVDNCRIQDEAVSLVAIDGLEYTNNRHFFNTTATSVAISALAGSPMRIAGNTYGASVTKSYTAGAGERVEQYDTAFPATGTWRVGDIVWHSTPISGGNIGWVCTVAGTSGTWKAFGTIA